MIDKIDVEKSRATEKICFQRGIMDQGIRWFIFLFLTLVPPILALIHLNDLKNDLFGQVIVICASFGFSALIILNATSPNSLKMTRVSSHIVNKEIMVKAIQELNWWIEVDDPNFLVVIPDSWFYQITIIINGSDFLISSVRFGRGDTFAFSEEEKLKVFLNKIGYTPANQRFKLTG